MPGGESGNGWATCGQGHRHWGLFGAAGLLVYVSAPEDPAQSLVLLQHRAHWAHHGGTWALPGGAMDSEETPAEAALREADEEFMLDPKLVVPRGRYSDDHGGWVYHTVLAQAAQRLRVRPDDDESDGALWLPAAEVDRLDLHPGFAETWPLVRAALVPLTVLVDGTSAPVTGALPGPDDPAATGLRLHAQVTGLTRSGVSLPPGAVPGPVLARWYPDFVLVLDEAAADAVSAAVAAEEEQRPKRTSRVTWDEPLTVRTAQVRVAAVPAGSSAGDVLAGLAAGTAGHCLVVSDQRGARDCTAAVGAAVAGLDWLLSQTQAS